MARRATVWGASLLAACLLLGCATSFQVHSDYDSGADFAALATFAWSSPTPSPQADPFVQNTLLEKRVREAVESRLREQGYGAVTEPEADFIVSYHAGQVDRMAVWDSAGGGPYVGLDGDVYWGPGYGYTATAYTEATLIVDVLAPGSRDLLWRGWSISEEPLQNKTPEDIRREVDGILSRFPPK